MNKNNNTTSRSVVLVNNVKENKDRRYGKGVVIAMSRKVIRLQQLKGIALYRVESETVDNKFYTVIYKEDAPSSCSCPDYDRHRGKIFLCKHMYGLMVALVEGTVIDGTDRKEELATKSKLQYQGDDYSF